MIVMKAFSHAGRRFKQDQHGTALIELAVVLPVLLLICLGVFEFGNAIYTRHLIENGVRDAARYIAGIQNNNPNCVIPTANQTAAKYIALTGFSTSNTNYRVSYWNPLATGFAFSVICTKAANGPTSCGSSKCYRGPDPIQMVTVSTDVPYQGLGFMGFLGLGTLTMHVQHEERLFGGR